MATSAQRYIAVAQKGSSTVRPVPFLTGTAIVKGDICLLDTNGRITLGQATAGQNVPAATATSNHLCLADQSVAAGTTQDTLVQAVFVNDDTVLTMPLTTNGLAQAWSNSFIGKSYEIRNVGGNYMVDVNASTNAKVAVIGPDPNTPSGDSWGRVLVRPIVGQWA